MSLKAKRISAALIALLLCACSANGKADDGAGSVSETASSLSEAPTSDEKLDTVKGFKGSTDKTSFTLKWKAVEGVDGYELFMRDASESVEHNYFISSELTEYTVSDRKEGECAFFTVKAYKKNGDELEYTAQSREIRLTTFRESCMLTVSNVCQYSAPALPTGCECAALTSLLRHCGLGVTKNEIASDYLEKIPFTEKKIKGKNGETELIGADPEEAFPGDPADENSYGCYSKPLANAANKYLETQDTDLRAKDLTGKKFSSLYKYVNNNTPVVVWATTGLKASKKTDSWKTKDGKEINWYSNEHCLVLVGYDTKQGVVYCSDPSKREVAPQRYDAKLFEKRYKERGSHAVIIE